MAGTKRYKTVEEMQAAIDKFFEDRDSQDRPYTITGLALALGFTSRQALLNYEGYTDEEDKPFFDTIKKAKGKVEDSVEEKLLSGKYNATGGIFNLKNNFDWKDKQEVENSGTQTLEVKIQVME